MVDRLRLPLFVLGCLLWCSNAAAMDLRLECPATVSPGLGFYLSVDSADVVNGLRVSFVGHTLEPSVRVIDGSSTALVLLGVGLSQKLGVEILRVEASGPAGPVVRERPIDVVARDYPEERLQVDKSYVTPPAEVQERIQRESELTRKVLATVSPQRLWDQHWKRPVPGGVTSPFGLRRVFNGLPRSPHRGVDLRAALGQPVHATADGVVLLARELYFGGNCVYLDHGQGVISVYAHLSSIQVHEGQRVERAQVLGLAGATGRVTGPHLHFGLAAQGAMIDALALFEQTEPGITGAPAERAAQVGP